MGFSKNLEVFKLDSLSFPRPAEVDRSTFIACWIDFFNKSEPIIKEFYLVDSPEEKSRDIKVLLEKLIAPYTYLEREYGFQHYSFNWDSDRDGDFITYFTKIIDKKIIAVTESGDGKVVNVSLGKYYAICKRCGNSGVLRNSVEDAIKSLQTCPDGCGKNHHYPWVPGCFR